MKLITYIFLLFCPCLVSGQYFTVNHTSGTATKGGFNVTVTANTLAATFGTTYCTLPAGAYYIGNVSNAMGYKYEFSSPVNNVRMRIVGQNVGEVITFYINGSPYTLTSANLSTFTGGCVNPGALTAIAGNLEVTTQYANGQVDIHSGRIDSFRVHHNGSYSLAGTVYDFAFSNDTAVFINAYTDTVLCLGDTMHIPYILYNAPFKSGNVFTFQLSDASGSFSTPTVLGTVTGTTGGLFTCAVPSSLTPSNNYRIRVVANNPTRISDDNGKNISIGMTRPIVTNSNNGPICPGQTLNLTASSTTTNTTYQWTGPNGFTSTLQNPAISGALPINSGDYIVTARSYGCFGKDTTTATIINTTAVVPVAGSNSPVCEKDTLYISGISTFPANSYGWTGPNGFSATVKDTFISNTLPGMSGDYILSAYYSGCILRDTVSVLVKPLPINLTISSNSPVCAGKTLTLIAGSSSTGTSYTWTGPLSYVGTTATANVNNMSALQAGKYYVQYLLNGCSVKDSINITVNPSPVAITATANTPLCQNDTLKLNSTNSTSGVTWQWAGPGSFSSNAKDTSFVVTQTSATGDYIVTATNSYNCKAIDTVTVLVKPLPAGFNAGSNTPVCAGSTLNISAVTSSTGVSFSWVGPNSFTSSLQAPVVSSVTLAAAGNYIVTGTLNGCSIKDTAVVVVNPLPATPVPSATTPVCIGQDLMLYASTVPGASYQWTSTTLFSATIQNPVVNSATMATAGKYYVRAVANNCYSPFDSVTVTVNLAPTIILYPSPNDSICQGATITFVSNNANAGSTYTRTWFKNSNVIGGAANANYSTNTAADKDEYYVTLTAYNICAVPYTDTSNKITVHVFPLLPASVSIAATPNTTVTKGTMINFKATPVNGGTKPAYQWTRNGVNIGGAISDVWGASTLNNNDQICVDMASNYLCPNPKNAKSNCIKVSIESTGITHTWTGKEPKIYPNPTRDVLIIEDLDKETIIQLNDVMGRILYNQICNTNTIQINTAGLVPGNYVLLLKTTDGSSMAVKISKD